MIPVADALVSVIAPFDPMLNHTAPDDEATVKILLSELVAPTIENLELGVVEPTPMFPFARIVKRETFDEEATLNGLRLDVDVACTLNA